MRLALLILLISGVAVAGPAAVKGNAIVVTGTIQYDPGKDTIVPESYPLLDAVADAIAHARKISVVEIQVYTDRRGSKEWNLKLSQARAESVAAYLTSQGIASERLRAKGYGESRKRRTEFVIVKRR